VEKKMFATCGDKDGGWRIVVQLQPEHADLLVSTDPRFERYARQPSCVSTPPGGCAFAAASPAR
jgi:hypothetical protein